MKNIIVIGISQSGLYDYVSLLDVNYGRQEGYTLLGGYFNSFGDQYRKEVENTQGTALTAAEFSQGSHRRTFGLNREWIIKDYRDYGSPVMSPTDEVKELEKRMALLAKAKGHYIMALTAWDLQKISTQAPHLMTSLHSLLEGSEVVILHPENIEEAAAAYLLANETGGWVVPKTNTPIRLSRRFKVSSSQLSDFEKQYSILKDISRKLNHAENLNVEKAVKGAGPLNRISSSLSPATFGRPVYSEKAISYFSDSQKIRELANKLS